MPLIRRLSLSQSFLLLGALLCVIIGLIMVLLRDQCVDTYFASTIGCKNTAYDLGVYGMNMIGALLMMVLLYFLPKYPRLLSVFAVILGLVLIWVGDIGSFFGGVMSLSAGFLTLASLL